MAPSSSSSRRSHHHHHHHHHKRAASAAATSTTAALLGALGTLGLVAATAAAAAAYVAARRRRARRGVSPARWRAAFDASTGAARSARAYAALMAEVAARGLHPAARPEAWPYLLGVFGARDTDDDKRQRLARLERAYASLQADCAALESVLNEALAAAGVGGGSGGGGTSTPSSATAATAAAAAATAAAAARAALPGEVARFAEALRIVLVDAVRCDYRPPALAALGVGESAAWTVRERAREVAIAAAAAAAAAAADPTTAAAATAPSRHHQHQQHPAGVAGAAQQQLQWLGSLISHALAPTEGGAGPAAPPPTTAAGRPSAAGAATPFFVPSPAATRAAAVAAAWATRSAVLPLPAWVSRAADRVLFEDEDDANGGGGGGAGAHLGPAGRRHAARLCALLSAYALHDPEAGYCQGMMDLAFPVLALVGGTAAAAQAADQTSAELGLRGGEEEQDATVAAANAADADARADAADARAQALAFACFERLMQRGPPPARRHFLPDEAGAFSGLRAVGGLIERHDRTLAHRLRALGAAGCLFAYRMLVVLGRRDLAAGQALALWEVGWADAWLRAHERRRRRAAQEAAAQGAEVEEQKDNDDDDEWYGLGVVTCGLGADDDEEDGEDSGSGEQEKQQQPLRGASDPDADADAEAGGGPLFPYFLAAAVASQRRRVLGECADPDDVLRLFHALGREQALRGQQQVAARLRAQEAVLQLQQRRSAAGPGGAAAAPGTTHPPKRVSNDDGDPDGGAAGGDDDAGVGEGPAGFVAEAAAAFLEGARRVARGVVGLGGFGGGVGGGGGAARGADGSGGGAPPEVLDFWACVERARAMRAADVAAYEAAGGGGL